MGASGPGGGAWDNSFPLDGGGKMTGRVWELYAQLEERFQGRIHEMNEAQGCDVYLRLVPEEGGWREESSVERAARNRIGILCETGDPLVDRRVSKPAPRGGWFAPVDEKCRRWEINDEYANPRIEEFVAKIARAMRRSRGEGK